MLPSTLRALRRRRDDIAGAVGEQVGATIAGLSRAASQLGLGPTAPATGTSHDESNALEWHQVKVDGRTVVYGTGGNGPPVLFLHGWALGSRAYRRALRRLTTRGCTVYAPAMPGFGGSDTLPRALMSIEGYGDWAARFLDAVGVTAPVLAVGHSFGGGVTVALGHRHPDRVRYLVLLNAVGGATWDGRRGRSLADRPLFDWAAGFVREFLPLGQGLDTISAVAQDVVGNVLRNPLVLVRAGELAAKADLTAELIELRAAQIPVLALTSERDQVIPSAAFDALCESVGAEGHVVSGGHAWILAEPDSFAEVVENIVEVEVAEHRIAAADDAAAQIRALLRETTVPARMHRRFVDDAPPLWLMSESPTTLATDVALCHPKLQPDEVRAVALPGPDGTVRLTVVAHDRPGLLADTCAVLTAADLPVVSASAMTWPSMGLAMHAAVVAPDDAIDAERFAALGDRLRSMQDDAPVPTFVPEGRASVEVSGAPAQRATVTVTAPDQLGLLWAISQWFADSDVSIEAVHATTRRGVARDTFIVVGDCVPDALATMLSRRPAATG